MASARHTVFQQRSFAREVVALAGRGELCLRGYPGTELAQVRFTVRLLRGCRVYPGAENRHALVVFKVRLRRFRVLVLGLSRPWPWTIAWSTPWARSYLLAKL